MNRNCVHIDFDRNRIQSCKPVFYGSEIKWKSVGFVVTSDCSSSTCFGELILICMCHESHRLHCIWHKIWIKILNLKNGRREQTKHGGPWRTMEPWWIMVFVMLILPGNHGVHGVQGYVCYADLPVDHSPWYTRERLLC